MGLLAALLPIVLIALPLYLFGRANVTDQDVAWFSGTGFSGSGFSRSAPSVDEASVYRRYLTRHRQHRLFGGLFGTVFAALVGIRLYQSVTIGIIEDGLPLADIWFCALAGIMVGALSAELFRMNEPPSDTIAASLAERGVEPSAPLILIARGLAATALLAATAIAVTSGSFDALGIAVLGALLASVAERTRQAVSNRRRPLLSESAKAVDIRIRTFALDSVTQLQVSAALLVAAWVASKFPDTEVAVVDAAQSVVVMGCLIASVVTLRRARPYPPRGWAEQQVAA